MPQHETTMAANTSTATFRKTATGIESHDPVLNSPSELYQFLVAHNDRPTMQVVIIGRRSVERGSNKTGDKDQNKVTTHTENVEDFRMVFDVSNYISTVGIISTLPNPETGRKPTLLDVTKEYVQSKRTFKEFHLEKVSEKTYNAIPYDTMLGQHR
ncbi:hypothetical protein BGZ73_006792 [Actinomortierella ambigua]|nr:hypothetical protein BGZ73_006792 [Actinomortierella ambigua]